MANYIICLAHFCELHGPSIIICTQVTNKASKSEHILSSNSKLQSCSSCKLQLPNDSINVITTDESDKTVVNPPVYISTNYPSSQKRYLSLTKLVMKSLSVETTADATKPMFVGDALNGYCVNKIIKIKDANARGSERKYALMVVSDSESDLLMNWDIIGMYFTEITSLLHLKVESTLEQLLTKKEGSGKSDSCMLDNERYLRRSMNKPKSLVELTNDPQIFVKFHLWGIELLKDILK
ncbi:uncharacterized protein CANTADRAFT_139734 [Suhomyces tanzawaensis NRRL Y-17324]|uniref:UDENN FLCN/SMCR8-type domain-containing protein n=1 Tax=Suhomyces tanzawaensis NRRL Y-17324 TaxID=984487 RepID=A0A1E4SSB6_9ASCO|nr:uncharacterized protein CANTADRAFT_139734 [Suhomyces tanzawaensis NRRL Y-17324]ODV82282.1 hypothetical protein CANTADRAFT_139734 [Suhomyces tanzawaensis NRRL Y-17324]